MRETFASVDPPQADVTRTEREHQMYIHRFYYACGLVGGKKQQQNTQMFNNSLFGVASHKSRSENT